MAEEHGFQPQAPEGHRLCANNCGFFGSPATQNLCSKCYQDLCLKNSGDSNSLFPASASSPAAAYPVSAVVSSPEKAEIHAAAVVVQMQMQPQPQQSSANRCSTCRKKVGLTGFRCRCGVTFCGTHRYPEKHSCTFDFKSMGREAIAKANPVVKGQKLEKI